MRSRTIWYVGFFDNEPGNKDKVSMAAVNKMSYIASELASLDYTVKIVSCAADKSRLWKKRQDIKICEGVELTKFPALPSHGKFASSINLHITLFRAFLYLLIYAEKNATLLIYHSMYYENYFKLLKKIKKVQVILEVEEIYSDLDSYEAFKLKEWTCFEQADKFIFSSHLLAQRVNKKETPYAVIYGDYRCTHTEFYDKKNRKINVLYSGTFDKEKGGCLSAIRAAYYLDRSYQFYIAGFGTQEEIWEIENEIATARQSGINITYLGLLTGEKFTYILQKCDIGLSTQNVELPFNLTSFPSKIITYLANGLAVVSGDLGVVREAALGKSVIFYDRQSAEAIAKAIEKCKNLDKRANKEVIENLARKFKQELKNLFEIESK